MSASFKKLRSTSYGSLSAGLRLPLPFVGVAMLVWCVAIHPAAA
jgi:hypothetical protein